MQAAPAPRPEDDAITVTDLTFRYFDAKSDALSKVNLRVRRGEFVGVLGPSQAGKTTLCYALTGLVPHDILGDMAGSVKVNGIDTYGTPVYELSKNYGFVFDNPEYQLSQATVEEEIALGLENRGVDPDEMDGIVKESLKTVGLEGLEKRSPFELSGGQQQRLALATMLAFKPPLLILDEPTSFLDPAGKGEVYEALTRLNRDGLTIILVDHEVELMAGAVGRVLVMKSGSILKDGSPSEVFGDVELMEATGLRVPQSAEVFVKAMGDAKDVPLTVASAAERIASMIGPRSGGRRRA